MAYFTRANLYYKDYSWRAKQENDNPRITGSPDSDLLDRNEGYEVLYLINQIATNNNWVPDNGAAGHKVEHLLRRMPGSIRSRSKIRVWLSENWN